MVLRRRSWVDQGLSMMRAGAAVIVGLLLFSVGLAAAESDARLRATVRKARRKAQAAKAAERSARDFSRDTLRVDYRIAEADVRIFDSKVTGQKYLAGIMRRERRELKESEERLRQRAEMEQMYRARLRRQEDAERTERALEMLRIKHKVVVTQREFFRPVEVK